MPEPLERLKAALADRYHIERELGAGGMATVYLAEDLKHHRKVAVKVLRPELAAILGGERFLREIATTAHLQHPGILPLFDSGQADSSLYYVMPYVEGETLRERMTRERQLPVEDAVRITESVANALHYAHQHGVIHRDIKPENILVQDGHALVADFGIALAVSQLGEPRLTETGLSMGTPYYMSPEQAAGERTMDERSDIYSLGAVLYEMLVGDPPHIGSSAQAVVAKILSETPSPISRARDLVPANVDAAVQKALGKSPADRFRTAADFAGALRDATFRVASSSEPAAGQALRARRWKWLALAAVGTTGILGVLTLGLVPRPGSKSQYGYQPIRVDLRLPEGQTLAASGSSVLRSLALAPDGGGLIYAAGVPGSSPRLWFRHWNSLVPSEIRGSENACCVAFSPDGKSVAFLVSPPALKVAPLTGGGPTIVADSGLADHLTFGGGVDWGLDGELYVSGVNGLVRVVVPGGALTTVTRLDPQRGDASHAWPSVLPNGKGALFTIVARSRRTQDLKIAVVRFATGAVEVLGSGGYARYLRTGHVLYAAEGGQLLVAPFDQDRLTLTGPASAVDDSARISGIGAAEFAVSDDGTFVHLRRSVMERQFVWVDRRGITTPFDPEWGGSFVDPVLSPDGRHVVVSGNNNLWLRGTTAQQTVRLTFDPGLNDRPSWVPGGREVSYASDRAGAVGIFRRRVDGTGTTDQIRVTDPRPIFGHAWSPDGRWLLLRTDDAAPGAGDILAIRPEVDSVAVPLVATPARELTPVISPDGRWLAYSSDETGRQEIFVSPFPDVSQARWQVSNAGGTEPRWSRSSRELFYRDGRLNLVAAAVAQGETFQVEREAVLFSTAEYYERMWQTQYDVSPDGTRFLMLRLTEQPSDRLVVVFNWLTELRARMED